MARSKKDGRRGGGHFSSRECWSLRGSIAKCNGWSLHNAKGHTHRIERRLGKLDTYARFVEAYVGDGGQGAHDVP